MDAFYNIILSCQFRNRARLDTRPEYECHRLRNEGVRIIIVAQNFKRFPIILYGRLCGGVEGNSYCEPKWFKSLQCDFLGSGPNLLLAIVNRHFSSLFEFYVNRINIIYYYYYVRKYTQYTYVYILMQITSCLISISYCTTDAWSSTWANRWQQQQ